MVTTIICGINCDCSKAPHAGLGVSSDPLQTAATDPATTDPEGNVVKAGGCQARETCRYAKENRCECGGVCLASQAKKGCLKGLRGECDCAAGYCKAAAEARKNCEKRAGKGGCTCARGQCVAAGFCD